MINKIKTEILNSSLKTIIVIFELDLNLKRNNLLYLFLLNNSLLENVIRV